MRKQKRPAIRQLWLRKLIRLHFVLTLLFVGTYLLVAFFDPGFLSYDLRQKFHALADDTIVVTATVVPPPAKPVVSATSNCNTNTGVLSVIIDWADDSGSTSFDIDRDSSTLITGLTSSNYSDTNVAVGTTYSYTVTAYGPMGPGIAISDPVSVTTDADCQVNIVATVSITTLNGKSLGDYEGPMPTISRRRPTFAGTTSIPNATIDIHLYNSQEFFAQTTANANGYWSWQVPSNLNLGEHTLDVTATDPSNLSRTASTTLNFRVIKNGDRGSSLKKNGEGNNTLLPRETSPLDFSLTIKNEKSEVEQGNTVTAEILPIFVNSRYRNSTLPVRFTLRDENGIIVFTTTRGEFFQDGKAFQENFDIPLYWTPGKYTLSAEVLLEDNILVSRGASFTVLGLPIFNLGEGKTLVYSQLMQNIGWISLLLLLLFFFWLFLLLREYVLYMRAKKHITERELKRAGYFDS